MIVQQILTSKGQGGVITVTPETKVSKAAELLTQHRIGGVIVSPDGKEVQGILSERDIVRHLSRTGAGCLDQRVDELMTPDPVCCTRQDTADSVLTRMTEGRFRHLPVVEDGVLSGIVTIGDVVKARLQQLAMEKSALEGMIMGH